MKRASKRRAIQRRPSRPHAIIKKGPPTVAEAIEKVLIGGDLSPLSVEQRLEYYNAVCKSLGLNPLTRPFDYIAFKESENAPAKLVLYARKDCTEQLRKIHGIGIIESTGEKDEGLYTVRVKAQDRTGRTDTGTGVVHLQKWDVRSSSFKPLLGRELANAIMKAETKAKRRATLSLAGLGFLDESELDSIENIRQVTPQGRIVEVAAPKNPYLDKYLEREAEGMKKLTTAQKEVVADKLAWAEPCLFWTLTESGLYEIMGNQKLKEENRELLMPLWNANAKAILATPEQLGKLISQFEGKVPFRELGAQNAV